MRANLIVGSTLPDRGALTCESFLGDTHVYDDASRLCSQLGQIIRNCGNPSPLPASEFEDPEHVIVKQLLLLSGAEADFKKTPVSEINPYISGESHYVCDQAEWYFGEVFEELDTEGQVDEGTRVYLDSDDKPVALQKAGRYATSLVLNQILIGGRLILPGSIVQFRGVHTENRTATYLRPSGYQYPVEDQEHMGNIRRPFSMPTIRRLIEDAILTDGAVSHCRIDDILTSVR